MDDKVRLKIVSGLLSAIFAGWWLLVGFFLVVLGCFGGWCLMFTAVWHMYDATRTLKE